MFDSALYRKAFYVSSRPRPTPSYKTLVFPYGLKLLVYGLFFLIFTSGASADSVVLGWNPVSSPNLAGYMVYYGPASGNYSISVDVGNSTTASFSGLQDGGTYYFVTTAYDAFGNESAFSSEVSYTTEMDDATPPTVTITSPSNGASVVRKSSTALSAIASDIMGVTQVQFYVNGQLICSDVSSPYSCNWQVPGAPGRSYQLQAKAYDTSGNVGTSSIITVRSQ